MLSSLSYQRYELLLLPLSPFFYNLEHLQQ
jgi:hypothetical protein